MEHEFDKPYWDEHWQHAHGGQPGPNPHLLIETRDLTPGTALDAGCGEGTEALWLAAQGWAVTAVDIAAQALARAAERTPPGTNLIWLEADLSSWNPARTFDLVTTHYAHPTIPQLDFHDRVAGWVAPGDTLLIVGHASGGEHPERASVTAAEVVARLDQQDWLVVTAEDRDHDVVVRAHRHH